MFKQIAKIRCDICQRIHIFEADAAYENELFMDENFPFRCECGNYWKHDYSVKSRNGAVVSLEQIEIQSPPPQLEWPLRPVVTIVDRRDSQP